jgi:multidrug efflux pump
MAISQRPGSNALAAAEAIERTMAELSKSFPDGIEYRIVYNPTVFVRQSIDAVIHTLYEAVGLVVLVVLLFLQNWRASLIPVIAIPVSLIGTFAAMAAFGFSLNMLSLFGLVLAIGIVVDDAIVVVENVERHIAAGQPPREAARKAMDEVTGAVIAIAFGLSAVFVPTAFLGGIAGQFYRQFALTIAVSTLLSAFNSLTLSPALCALLLKPHGGRKDWFERLWDRVLGAFFVGFNRRFDEMGHGYSRSVGWLVRRAVVGLGVYVILVGCAGLGFSTIPTGFIPAQDKGYLITGIQLPDGASLERTDAVVRRASDIILKTPGVKFAVAFAGFSGATRANSANAGAIFVVRCRGGARARADRRRDPHGPAASAGRDSGSGHLRDRSATRARSRHIRRLQAARAGPGGRGFRPLQEATDGSSTQPGTTRLSPASSRRSAPPRRSSTPTSIASRLRSSACRSPASSTRSRRISDRPYVNDLNLFGRTSRYARRPRVGIAGRRPTSHGCGRATRRARWCRSARWSTSSGGAVPTASCGTICSPRAS